MKYFKSFTEHINETKITDKILYHGSLYVFKSFKDTTTFFSETPDFAESYASTKSQDLGMDREPILYKVKVNCNILDINKTEDFEKLKNVLPDKVEYSYNNFGFTTEVDKNDILFNMTGFHINKPYEPIKNCKIGDEIPEPTYPSEKWIVYKIDKKYVYTYDKKEMNHLLRDMFSSSNYNIKTQVKNIYKPINNYIENYIKSTTDKKYVGENDIKFYSYIFFGDENYSKIYDIIISESNIKEFLTLYEETKENLKNYLIETNYTKNFNVKPEKIKLNDTWRYFENITVHSAIVNLGYDGYVARESKVPTYAIFHPQRDTEILSYEIPSGGNKFDSWDDWLNYKSYDKYISDNMQKDKLYKISKWDTYKYYKKGVSKEECLKLLS